MTLELELEHGAQRVVVTSRGGGIREWPGVLDGYEAGAEPLSARGQVLIPWPNRITDGRYEWDGETQQLPLNKPPYAIHGLVREAEWTPSGGSAFEHLLQPRAGYPFSLRLRIEYALDGDGLTVRTIAENVGDRAAPFGAGFHPYVARHADDVFGRSVRLDDTRPFDGELRVADVTVWADDAFRYVQLFTGDEKPDVARRAVAVEPMTCPPEAFRSGEGVIRLEPGDAFDARWGITV